MTRAGWVPEDWVPSVLGGAKHFLTSGSRGWSQYYSNSGDLFVRITNLSCESIRLDYTDCCFVKLPSGSSEGTRTRLNVGDILISITADLGIIAYFSPEEPYPRAYVNQHVALLRLFDHNVCSKFVAYQLAAPPAQRRFREITDQGAKAGLNLPAIRSFPIVLPSLPEQEAIAEVLECWDKAIRGYEKKIETKRKIKKGLMQGLLTGKRRLPGLKGEWEDAAFGNIFIFLKTYAFSREQLTTEGADGSRHYNIHYGDIHATYDGSILNCAAETRIPRLGRSSVLPDHAVLLQDGDLVIADASEDYEGVCACVELHNVGNKAITGGLHTFAARDTTGKTACGYRGYLFQETGVSQELKRIATGVSVYSVSKTNLAKVRIWLPPLREQRAIAAVLSSADAEIEALDRKLAALREQKRFLLNNLVTGAIRLPRFRLRGASATAAATKSRRGGRRGAAGKKAS